MGLGKELLYRGESKNKKQIIGCFQLHALSYSQSIDLLNQPICTNPQKAQKVMVKMMQGVTISEITLIIKYYSTTRLLL